jgi:hypothetical protein
MVPPPLQYNSQTAKTFMINPLISSGNYMYHQFNIQKFYVLPTWRVYVFFVDLGTNSDYFTIQHSLTGFYDRDGGFLLCGTSYIIQFSVSFYEKSRNFERRLLFSSWLSARLSGRMENLVPTGRNFINIYILIFFFENLSRKCKFH